MRIWTRVSIIWDESQQAYVRDDSASEWHEYVGPIARCGGKGGGAPSPDPAIGQAALQNIQLGKEWLSFARDQFDEANVRQRDVDALNKRVTESQLAGQDKANTRADEQYARLQRLFFPIEDRMVQDAQNFDTPVERERAAATAGADIQQAAKSAREQQARQQAAMGIRPDSGRTAALDSDLAFRTSLAEAGAKNTARERVRAQGMALRESAANFGRGFASTSAQQASLGLQSGSSALGNQLATEGNFRANQGIMSQGYQGAIGANASGAGILNQQYQGQLQAAQMKSQEQGQLMNSVGQLGMAAAVY